MEGDRSADGDAPRSPSLFDRLFDRRRSISMRPRRSGPRDQAWRWTLAIVVTAAIAGCVATGCAAFLAAFATERRIAAIDRAAPAAAARLHEAEALAERFDRPGLDERLTRLARALPQEARLVLIEDRRITLRTIDPDHLRDQLRGADGVAAYVERGQRMAPDGGIDVTLEARR